MRPARVPSASRCGRSTGTGNRLRQQLIDEETREPIAPEHKGRGYEVAKGQYLPVEDAELEAIEIESTHTVEIDSFVPRSQIDQRFFDSPYYVMPSEPVGQEAFAVIRSPHNKKIIRRKHSAGGFPRPRPFEPPGGSGGVLVCVVAIPTAPTLLEFLPKARAGIRFKEHITN
jgi:hypothetical protein